jgi:chromosome segregation ATPase
MIHDIEALSAAWLTADAERQRHETTLRQLEHKLSREGAEMGCAAYMELSSTIAQQKLRFEAAEAKAADRLAALTEARAIAQERELREIAERRFQLKQTEFEQAETALNSHRQQIATLTRELPALEQRFNLSLRALADAKQALPAN